MCAGFCEFSTTPGVSKVLKGIWGCYRDHIPNPNPQQSIVTDFSDHIQNGPGQPRRRITLNYKTCNFLFPEGDFVIIMNVDTGPDLTT